MADRYYLPISTADGVRMPRAYASVIEAILKTIRENGNLVEGKPICLPQGYFEVILRPGKRSGIGRRYGRVRIRFSYPNLYLEAFKSRGRWYRFSNTNPEVIPAGEPVTPLPFESGYQANGMEADFAALRFGRETMLEIYKALGSFANNPQDMENLKKILAKCCVMFPEVIRFDILRRFMMRVVNGMVSRTVHEYSPHFTNWSSYSRAIRRGIQGFEPFAGTDVDTFGKLLSLVAVLLDVI